MNSYRIHLSVFFVSIVGLCYEVVLTRIFSIAQWHHFAYMIISMAMFGFALAGTVLSLLSKKLLRKNLLVMCATGLLVPSIPICFMISQSIPFETFELTTQPLQIFYLFLLYLLLSIPFFLVSGVIALAFMTVTGKIGTLYFANLTGSSAGALLAVLFLYLIHPTELIYGLMIPAGLSFMIVFVNSKRDFMLSIGSASIIVLLVLSAGFENVRLSRYKPLHYIQNVPDSVLFDREKSPLSVIKAVYSKQLRESPGQISGYPYDDQGPIPKQIGLYPDGNGPSVVNQADSPPDLSNFAYLDYVTPAIPYKLRDINQSIILGAGGGTSIWNAIYHQVEDVSAVEVDPGIHALMKKDLKTFSGNLYGKKQVHPKLADARGFLESTTKKYDLIELPPANSLGTSGSGVHALSENYLYTIESFQLFMNRLKEEGMISITSWLKNPPRNSLKVIATLLEAARKRGMADLADHLVAIRSWNTITVVFAKSKFKNSEIKTLQDFVETRSFDPVYYSGLPRSETNRRIQTENPVLFEATKKLLRNPESLYDEYVFDIKPPEDDRPYFNFFFKWSSWERITEQLGSRSSQFVEWGYLILLLSFLQAILLAFLILVIPFLGFSRNRASLFRVFLVGSYFFLLGIGFMLIEISFIQIFMRYLHYPVFSLGVVLTGFLAFSGFGSYVSECSRMISNQTQYIFSYTLLVFVTLTYLIYLPSIFQLSVQWSPVEKIIFSFLLLIPLAGPLGIPFPTGLREVSSKNEYLIPFAWASNGASSILGAILGILLAVHFGFHNVILLSLLIYALAGINLTLMRNV